MFTLLAAAAQTASDPGTTIGKNIDQMLSGFAGYLWIGIVSVMVVTFIMGRHFSKLATFVLVAILVGIIVKQPATFINVVTAFGDAISKGV